MKKIFTAIFPLIFFSLAAVWLFTRPNDTAPAPTQSQTVAAPESELIIGINLELSGKFAPSANSSLKGSQLAVAEINQKGGLLGKKVRLAIGDNRSDETLAAQVYGRLVNQNHAVAIIGPMYSTIAIASGPLADELKVPFIATSATNPRVTVDDNGRTRPYAFRVCFIDSFQGTVMADFALRHLKTSRAAVYVDDSAYYSQGLASFFSQAYLRQGGRVVYKAGYTPEVTDFRPPLQLLLDAKPEVIFVPGYYSEVAKIIEAARKLGFNGPIIGGDAWEEELLLPLLPPALLDNTFYSAHFSLDDASPEVKDFSRRYLAFANEAPSQSSVLAYDATMLLAAAIKTANSSDSVKIREAIEQTRDFKGISGLISLNERHNATKSAVVMEIKDGHSVFRARIEPTQ